MRRGSLAVTVGGELPRDREHAPGHGECRHRRDRRPQGPAPGRRAGPVLDMPVEIASAEREDGDHAHLQCCATPS
jgi:hypothetical protein